MIRLHLAALLLCCTTSVSTAQWTDGQAADLVLGQPNLTSNTDDDGSESATSLDGCSGIAIDFANGKMYVADEDNNRILRYSYPIATDQQAAELVFGQADFAGASAGRSQNSFFNPRAIAVDNTGRLWVADRRNHRVIWFNTAHTIMTNQPNANGVLGQANFTSGASATAANGMKSPAGVFVTSDGTLWVADAGNHRVLRFDDAANKNNGANAEGVLGQADFTSATIAAAANRMHIPNGVFVTSDGTLWVADAENNRVLRFDDAANKSNGANAEGVLGQADFTSTGSIAAANRMNSPLDVSVDAAGRLYVLEFSNNRVLIFNDAANKANGASADNVLGQADFTSNGKGVTASIMDVGLKSSIEVDNTNKFLWVSDTKNNRVIRFTASSLLPVELTFFKGQATTKGNALQWQTASEQNNHGFEVQRSDNGKEWKKNGFVAGNGTTVETQDYSFLDTSLAGFQSESGRTLYYRLKQIDFDGSFEYSDVVAINNELGMANNELTVFPNPSTDILNYQIANLEAVQSVQLFDVFGKLVKVAEQVDGQLSLTDLTAGMYVLVVEMSGDNLRQVVVKH